MAKDRITSEEEYVLKREIELIRKLQEERRRNTDEQERRRLRELHFMRCPKCGMELKEIEFRGIKVDRCFSCEGTWFDSGEVEAITKLEKGTLTRIINLFKKK